MKKVNLNTASHEEIANLPMVEGADFIIQNRPFHSWDDVGKVVGIGGGLIDDLKKGMQRLIKIWHAGSCIMHCLHFCYYYSLFQKSSIISVKAFL